MFLRIFMHVILFAGVLCARDNSNVVLVHRPITLTTYQPAENVIGHFSDRATHFGNIDINFEARVWLLAAPTRMPTIIKPNKKAGQQFVDIKFSPGTRYAVIDSILPSAGPHTKGRLLLHDLRSNLRKMEVNTHFTEQSIYAFFGDDIFAYVPALTDGHTIIIHNLATGVVEVLDHLPHPIGALTFNEIGDMLAGKDTYNGDITMWHYPTGMRIAGLVQPTPFPNSVRTTTPALAFFANSTLLADRSGNCGLTQVWNVNKETTPFLTATLPEQDLAIHPDDQSVILPDVFGDLSNIEESDPSVDHVIEPFEPYDLIFAQKFNPSGSLLAVATGMAELALLDGKNYSMLYTAMSPDNSSLDEIAFVNDVSFLSVSNTGHILSWSLEIR